MIQRPNAVGLILCQQVIVEEKTRNMTLVNSFVDLVVNEFPSSPQQFTVFVVLTDGLGDMTLTLEIAPLDTLETIYVRSWLSSWKNPLRAARLMARVGSCSFPAPGQYQVSLLAENDLITQGVFNVIQKE